MEKLCYKQKPLI